MRNQKWIALLGINLFSAGCNSTDLSTSSGGSTVATSGGTSSSFSARPARIYSAALTSCNPMGSGSTSAIDLNLGIAARLYYSPAGQPEYTDVESYMNDGTDLGVDIFFNQVNVIPTYFSAGFPSAAGPPFETPDGSVLMEWFGIRYKSTLRLTANDQPGNYQLATLSDDGSILYLDPTGGQNPVDFVDNDGSHATQMACAKSTLAMDASTQIPFQLDYFQGPRYHLTSMLLWRRVPDGASLSDPACGVVGINTFFDTTHTPSVPQPYYESLLSRGWEVIPAENFVLPDTNPENPCFPGGGILGI
jgi:hypothetical protein